MNLLLKNLTSCSYQPYKTHLYIYERSLFVFKIKERQLQEFVTHDGLFPTDALFYEKRKLVEDLFPSLTKEEVEKQYLELFFFLYQKYAPQIQEKFNPDLKLIKKTARRALYALNRGQTGGDLCDRVNGCCLLLERVVWLFNQIMGQEHVVLSYTGSCPRFKLKTQLPAAKELERYSRDERRILRFVWAELQSSYNLWTGIGDECRRVYVVKNQSVPL